MKKGLIIIISLLIFFLIFLFSGESKPVYADNEIEKNLEEEINSELVGLDLSGFEALFNQLEKEYSQKFGASIIDLIRKIIDGEVGFSFELIFESVWNAVKLELFGFIPAIVTIVIIAVLYGIFKGLSSGFAKESTSKIIYFVCYGAIIGIITYAVSDVILSVRNALSAVNSLSDVVFPILLTFTTALGGTTSVAVFQPFVAFFSSAMIKIIDLVIFPLFYCSMIFKIVGNLSDNLSLNKLSSTAKSAADWILGIIFSLFTGFLTVQGITGASIDTVGIKSAKFALSSYVPILGGYISEGFDLVMASCILIKNAVGLCGVIVLFLIVLAPVVKTVCLMFSLRLASGIVEAVGDKKFSELLFGVSKSLSTLVAILCGLGFLLFIMIMLIILSCNFGVL